MLTVGPEICHVDRCSHGCTRDTGCQGIEWRKNHAEQALRDRGADLIADGWKWGFDVTVEIRPSGVRGTLPDECDTCRKALPEGCNTEFQGEASCALTHGAMASGEASAWWALVMGAAASIEDAANCLRDPDAKKQADGAVKHYREAAQKLIAARGVNPSRGGDHG